jgi:hypothetical protein
MKRFLARVCVFALLPLHPLVAQDSTSTPAAAVADRPYRDPQRARTLAKILPGAGHVYSGEYLQAYGYWVGTAVGISVGVALYDEPCAFAAITTTRCTSDELWSSHLTGIALVSLGLYTWVRSVRDAPLAAERANTRHAKRHRRITPLVQPPAEQGTAWRAGLNIGW